MAVTDFFRSTVSFSLFAVKEVLYLEKSQPSCYAMVALFTTDVSAFGELLLCSMSCERFIALRYPLRHWSNVKKAHLHKVIFACFVISVCASQFRIYTNHGQLSNIVVFSCSWISTMVFSVLIWRTIKQRNQNISTQVNITPSNRNITRIGATIKPNEEAQTGHHLNNNFEIRSFSHEREEDEIMSNEINQPGMLQRNKRFIIFSALGATLNNSMLNLAARNESTDITVDHPTQIETTSTETAPNSLSQKPNALPMQGIIKSQRKTAKIATFLALSALPTRIIPLLVFVIFSRKAYSLLQVAEPWIQTLTLSIALINPLIYINANEDIKRRCIKLLKCK